MVCNNKILPNIMWCINHLVAAQNLHRQFPHRKKLIDKIFFLKKKIESSNLRLRKCTLLTTVLIMNSKFRASAIYEGPRASARLGGFGRLAPRAPRGLGQPCLV